MTTRAVLPEVKKVPARLLESPARRKGWSSAGMQNMSCFAKRRCLRSRPLHSSKSTGGRAGWEKEAMRGRQVRDRARSRAIFRVLHTLSVPLHTILPRPCRPPLKQDMHPLSKRSGQVRVEQYLSYLSPQYVSISTRVA